MTSRVSLSILALLCSLPSLCPVPLFAADPDVPGGATASPDGGAGSASESGLACPKLDPHARGAQSKETTPAPAITGLRIVTLTGPSDCMLPNEKVPAKPHSAKTRARTRAQTLSAQDQKPACAGVAVSPTGLAHFELAIAGTHLLSGGEPTVQLETADAGRPIVIDPRFPFKRDNEIDVTGDAPLGTVIKVVKVGSACNDSFTVTFTPKASGLQKFLVKLDHETNAQFPNLHSLVLTKQSGDGGFAAKPSLMSVDLQPTGPTDLAIVQTSEAQLDLHFVAAQDYVPANAVVTVYDSSDLDVRKPIAIAASAPAADPNAPTISSVETVFLDRGNGNGRIRIHGKGFGKQAPAAFPVDDYLCDCVERPQIDGYQACRFLDDVRGLPAYPGSAQRTPASTDTEAGTGEHGAGAALFTTQQESRANKEELQKRSETDRQLDRLRNRAARDETDTRLHREHRFAGSVTDPSQFCSRFEPRWVEFQKNLRGKVSVGLDSVNPEVRVQRAHIVDFNDQMIDVYFEFTRHRGYAWPFRLGNVTVAVTKEGKSAQQTVGTPSVQGEVDQNGPTSFSVSQTVGPAPDPNLTYQYTVLNEEQAKVLLGRGVANHFIVCQLSVVNHGKSDLVVPLAAIQVEVEWLRGRASGASTLRPDPRYFIEGPATVAPLPLASVSAYFGNDQKTGWRSTFFNVLTGVATMAAALVPLSGPALKDAQVVFTGGFVPAAGQVWVDLSAQQLENLTSLSWESTETVPAGGSVQGYIFIQRGEEAVGILEPTTGRKTFRQISNLMGLNLSGFAVSSTSTGGTPAAKTPGGNGTSSTSGAGAGTSTSAVSTTPSGTGTQTKSPASAPASSAPSSPPGGPG
jgi:hypothetical protein